MSSGNEKTRGELRQLSVDDIDEQSKITPLPSRHDELLISESSSRNSQSNDKMDRKLLGTRETKLSVLKIAPFSLGGNNKVASSFPNQHQVALNYLNQANQASIVLPVTSRKVRDSSSLLFMLAFLGFLAYIIWDGIIVKETDINLIVHGHDSYGNICGRNNQPIKHVEKSGKNYTSKIYTKYTLINAQFERYTLDSGRSKDGELFYVKQDNDLYKYTMKEDVRARKPKQLNGVANQTRSRRAAPLTQMELKNKTQLNQLKSTLMYQYPPMYGYKPEARSDMEEQLSFVGASKKNQRPRQQHYGQLETSASQLSPNVMRVLSTENVTRLPSRVSLQTVNFDDSAIDQSRNEHILINPITTNFVRTRSTPDILNQNEVSSQLLYLTECVDYCPTDHVELIFYRCMPKNWRFSLFPNAINVTRTFIDDIMTDVTQCYRELIYIFSLSLVLSISLLILLRFLASFIIWSCLTVLITLFITMAGYSWFTYYYQVLELNNIMPHDSNYLDRLTKSDKWLMGSIFLTFLAFASIATVVFMRKRILMVTMLFRESGKAIADMPLLLLQPVLTFAALGLITAVWCIGLICLQSIKSPVIDLSTGFVVFKAETIYKIMKWYHIFAFLWVSHFAIACQHYVIGAAVSKWYFSTDRYNLHSPIGSSVSELILYYLGSVALGSFLMAIFKVVRVVTRQIQYLVQRNCMTHTNADHANQVVSSEGPQLASSSCCGSFAYVWRLFIWFFDNIIMIINRDAYVEIAIHGHSFLKGAQQAFTVLATNPLKLLAIKSVSNLLLIVAKICVVFGTVSMALVLLEEKTHQLNYSWSPIVISAMYAYIVAHWFLSVYEMVIDALFICYCEDHERSKKQEARTQLENSNFMMQLINSGQLY